MNEAELDRFLAVYIEQRSRLATRELRATVDELVEIGRQHGVSEAAVRASIEVLCVRGTVVSDGPYVYSARDALDGPSA